MGGEDLAGKERAGFASAAGAGADDEVGFIVLDRRDEAGRSAMMSGAVAVHEDEDSAGGERGFRSGEAGGTVAAGGLDDAGSGLGGDGGGGVGAAVVDDDALGDEVPGHFGDDVADGFGFVESGNDEGDGDGMQSYQTTENANVLRLEEADVDVDLGVVGIGSALVVDLEVGAEGAFAA